MYSWFVWCRSRLRAYRLASSILVMLLGLAACKGSTESGVVPLEAGQAPMGDASHVGEDSGFDARGDDASPEAGPRDPLTDESVWSRVDVGGPCELYEADLGRAAFPKRSWRACGTGCLVADAPVWGTIATLADGSASFQGGDTYVRMVVKSPRGALTHVSRLSDGATVAAVEQRQRDTAACAGVGGAADAPLMIPYAPGTSGYVMGRTDVSSVPARVRWPGRLVTQSGIPTCLFGWDAGWGMCFYDGAVRVVASNDSAAMMPIDVASVPAFHGSARNELAVWTGWDAATRQYVAKAYRTASGTWTVAAVDQGDVNVVALSDQHLVWVGVHGPKIGQGTYESAEFYWAPVVATQEPLKVTRGPSLPVTGGLSKLAAKSPPAVVCRLATAEVPAGRSSFAYRQASCGGLRPDRETSSTLFLPRRLTRSCWVKSMNRRPTGTGCFSAS